MTQVFVYDGVVSIAYHMYGKILEVRHLEKQYRCVCSAVGATNATSERLNHAKPHSLVVSPIFSASKHMRVIETSMLGMGFWESVSNGDWDFSH